MGFLTLIVTIRGGTNKLILDLCLRANTDIATLGVISQPTRKYACYPINTKWGMYCTDPMLSIRGLLGLENANHAYIVCSNAKGDWVGFSKEVLFKINGMAINRTLQFSH